MSGWLWPRGLLECTALPEAAIDGRAGQAFFAFEAGVVVFVVFRSAFGGGGECFEFGVVIH